jgi:hypothetical protein
MVKAASCAAKTITLKTSAVTKVEVDSDFEPWMSDLILRRQYRAGQEMEESYIVGGGKQARPFSLEFYGTLTTYTSTLLSTYGLKLISGSCHGYVIIVHPRPI